MTFGCHAVITQYFPQLFSDKHHIQVYFQQSLFENHLHPMQNMINQHFLSSLHQIPEGQHISEFPKIECEELFKLILEHWLY